MASPSCLVMIKPKSILQYDNILRVIQDHVPQFSIVRATTLCPTREQYAAHYAEHSEKPFFQDLIRDMEAAGVAHVMEIQGEQGMEEAAFYKAMAAVKDEVRAKYSVTRRFNAIHTSDDAEAAEREISVWFEA